MIITASPTGDALATIAAMHCAAMPNSLISKIGYSYAVSLYRFAASSRKEMVFAAISEDDKVVGGALLSFGPRSVMFRAVFRTSLLLHAARSPRVVIPFACAQLIAFMQPSEHIAPGVPEVIAIFAAEGRRGLGIGRRLLRAVEAALRRKGCSNYVVRTEDNPGNQAIRFYEREGFFTTGTLDTLGMRFRVMCKSLSTGIDDSLPSSACR